MSHQAGDAPPDGAVGTSTASHRSEQGVNVNKWERVASAALGGLLLVRGLRRRSLGGAATAAGGGALLYRGLTGGCPVYRRLGVSTATGSERSDAEASADATEVERSITVGESPDELYEFWRDPEQFAKVFGHFAEVTRTSEDPERYRWTMRGPLGRDVTWETEVVEERPGEFLRWKSPEDALVPNESSVRFRPAPADQGTEVTLRVHFDPPGGALGDAVAKRLNVVPDAVARKALRRSKSLVETGEIPTLEGNPSGRGSGDLL